MLLHLCALHHLIAINNNVSGCCCVAKKRSTVRIPCGARLHTNHKILRLYIWICVGGGGDVAMVFDNFQFYSKTFGSHNITYMFQILDLNDLL